MSEARNSGIGFGGLLTILFIGLKLTNYIEWSWLWVLAPVWIPVVFGLVVMAVFGLIALVIALVGARS